MIWWPLIMHVIQSYCKPLLFYLYASECFTWPVVRRGDATCTEKCSGALFKLLLVGVHWTKSWEIVTCSLSCSSCSTNLVINGLNKTSTQVNCIVFSLFLLFFALSFILLLCVSVSDSVSVCSFATIMANKDLYTTASVLIQPIQDNSTDSAIRVTRRSRRSGQRTTFCATLVIVI